MIVSAGTGIALALALGGFAARGGGLNGTRYGAALVLAASSLAFVVGLYRPAPVPARSAACDACAQPRAGGPYASFCVHVRSLSRLHRALPGLLDGRASPPADSGVRDILDIDPCRHVVRHKCKTHSRFECGTQCGTHNTRAVDRLFLCAFVVNDLNHLVGPHRADLFDLSYQLSLALLVLALLVRFAGAIVERRKVRMAEAL